MSTRRDVLAGGALVGALTLGSTAAGAATAKQAGGRKFKAWISRGTKRGEIHELELLPIGERQLIVRNEATSCCYTLVKSALGLAAPDFRHPERALIMGHGGVGIVEAVGPGVRRVKVGDRVIVATGPNCGVCRSCIRGRPDFCLAFFEPEIPVAKMKDGTEVYQTFNIGGNAELMVPYEDWVYPVTSNVSSVDLCVLGCSGTVGLAATTAFVPVEPNSNVVVLGAGLLGLSAVQGARIMGAGQIIAVDPIPERRELARKLGATTVLDPNVEKDKLVARIRSLCPPLVDRTFSGGGPGMMISGADFVIEAVGGDQVQPKAPAGPDPTGITSLKQAWEVCTPTGHYITLGGGQTGSLVFDTPGWWAVSNKTHHPSTYGGAWALRDIPRFVKLIERGQYNSSALISSTFSLEGVHDAYQQTADRIGISVAIKFT